MSQEFGLHRLATPELTRLLRALHRGVLPSPISRSALIEKAFGHIEADLDLIVGRDIAAAKAVIIAVIGERDGVRGQLASLSYCGVPTPGTRSRDLVDQVRELVASATKSIHLYGMLLGDDAHEHNLLRTLGALMSGRDVKVRLVFDAGGAASADAIARTRRFVAASLGANTNELLEAYVCTRGTFRARVVVVDDTKVLVTSGELTAVEEDGFLDIGAVFSDSGYIRALSEEWARMVANEIVLPVSRVSE
ncbi:MAG: hypothetical protein JWN04_1617 [Myxococcaceae bacterium]|nr:hypothetical protein [Myxococcaceae bacterium]